MNTSWVWCMVLAAVLLSPACRQPDGPVPTPSEEDSREIVDVSKDLLAVAGGDAQAIEDLSYDIGHLGHTETGVPLAPELGKRLARAISGRKLTDEQARALAHQMYLTFGATELSGRQVDKIEDDVRMQLTQLGVPEDAIDPIVRQIDAVQDAVSTVQKRWWQVR